MLIIKLYHKSYKTLLNITKINDYLVPAKETSLV